MALTRPRYSQIYDTDYKQSVRVATTEDVGNLLVTGNMTNSVDGVTVVVEDRILVKDQIDAKQNGIYRVASAGTGSNGTWVRALDADANDKVTSGLTTTITEGSVEISKTYKLSTPDPIVLGTTELIFTNPYAAGSVAGIDKQIQYNDTGLTAGSAGLTFNKTGNVLTVGGNVNVTGSILPTANVTYDLGSATHRWRTLYVANNTIDMGGETISVNTATGTWSFGSSGTTISLGKNADFNPPTANISGNITAGNVSTTNITGTLQTASQPHITTLAGITSIGASGSTTLTGILQTAAQTNVTSLGTLTALTVTGNVSSGNISTQTITLANGSVIKDTSGIAIGYDAGKSGQGGGSLAIGYNAGKSDLGPFSVAVGYGACETGNGSYMSTAVGNYAGRQNQGPSTVALGYSTGVYSQGAYATAIGSSAGHDDQSQGAIAIGFGAGYNTQGANAIAIGMLSGYTNQPANTIVISATGIQFDAIAAQTDSFYVNPIRNATGNVGTLQYNGTTKEVTYSKELTAANVTVTGTLGVAGILYANASTASTTHTDGALVVAGGVGIGGNVHIQTGKILHVGMDLTNSYANSVAQFNSNVNSYSQVLFQNTSTDSGASGDFIVVADNGTDSANYIDFGINSSTYSDVNYTIGTGLDGYTYTNGGNYTIGTQTSGKGIIFHTGGTLSANKRATLNDTGFTVNTTTQSTSLTTGALVVNGGAGIAGDLWIGGNLHVANLISTSSTTLTLNAPLAYFEAAGATYPYNYDIGFYSAFTGGPANVYAHTGFVRDDNAGSWNLFSNVAEPGIGHVSLTNAIYDGINTGAHTIKGDSVTALINGGTSGVGNIGSSSAVWNTVYATKLQGTLTTVAQTNITSVGTLTALGVTGTVTAGAFSGPLTGAVTGNASTATALQTARAINGVNFDGTAAITVTAAAGTLSGATLASGVTASSLTSVGTLAGVTLSGTLKRSAAGTGHMEGSYASIETASTPGAIYTIGGTYQPTASTLGNMYGIGYTYVGTNQFSLTTNTGAPTNAWGMYVASNGTARIFLDSDDGVVYATANKAKYADLAEKYTSDKNYVAGTVVVFGGNKEITISTVSHDTAVAGVISTDPAYLMNNMIDGLPVALQGRVPCRVQGPINKGELVVTSDTAGVAQRLDRAQYLPGCVIGKALEDITEGEIATIEVVVGRV